jgi:DNA (cytosine-5)-methyltransferase 1
MPQDMMLRNVPSELYEWVKAEGTRLNMSQAEFVASVLRERRLADERSRMPLLFPDPPVETSRPATPRLPFRFIDLFAGIGGFRIALERVGGECVFSCEWDRYSQRTYREWFGEVPRGNIREIMPADLPPHDILAAGFPCQPFSIAGVSKKKSLGRPHGFKCVDQGNLFFVLARLIEAKRPPVLFLENVKNLKSHDGGRTWSVISETLGRDYWVFPKVIDAAGWVPQHRERIYIVCFDKGYFHDRPAFRFPEPPSTRPKLKDILEPTTDPKYTLSEHLWKYLQEYAEKHKAKGNGFGFGLADPNGITRTLSARYYKDGSEILIDQNRGSPRRLTPRECARLMGFENEDKGCERPIVVSDTQAYRQFGNAVVPRVVEAVALAILPILRDAWRQKGNGCLLYREPSEAGRVTGTR